MEPPFDDETASLNALVRAVTICVVSPKGTSLRGKPHAVNSSPMRQPTAAR